MLLSVGLIPITDLLKNLDIKINARTKGPVVNEHNETSIPGIFVAGNGLHVHDLVDYVSNEARLSAQGVYKFLNGNLHYNNALIVTKNENGIGYIVPQVVNYLNLDDKFVLKFRVTKPFKNVDIVVKADNQIIKKIFKLNLIPSEMENIEITKDLININTKEISVEVKER